VASIMGEGPFARFARIKHPVARDEDLLVEHLDDETVVYDSRTKEAHCLSNLAALVFEHSDGETTIEQLAKLATDRLGEPVDERGVVEALAQLQERDLLAVPPRDALSRRQMIGKTAAAGGALVGASLITTIVAPTAAATATHFCTNLCDCCDCGCKNLGQTCDNGGNNCCFGSSCSCTHAESGENAKHCKPANAGAVICSGVCSCGTPGVGGCNG
jgi:hypothetical protein